MDTFEFEGKTYEEAIKKASLALEVEEKDLDIEVKEVDTKGILGLLGTKKIRIIVNIKKNNDETISSGSEETPEDFGKQFLYDFGKYIGMDFQIMVTDVSEKIDRMLFLIQCDNGDVLVGKDGEILESLQYILRLAVAKKFKQNLKILIDINGYRERRKKSLTIMAKRLADKVRRTGRKMKTDPLNPYERRIIHTLFKHNKNVTTKSEGEGHIKKIIISPTGNVQGNSRGNVRGRR